MSRSSCLINVCKAHKWCELATNAQYSKLCSLADSHLPINELAAIIYICSLNTLCTINDIEEKLSSAFHMDDEFFDRLAEQQEQM